MVDARIFLDTNSFIQLRDLKDLPFATLVPDAEELILLVSPTVIDELDIAKTGTNKRKRDRARSALRLIDQASTNDGFRLLLSERRGVRVFLQLADDPAPDWSSIPKFDPRRADDRLVAETLTHGHGAQLFSHDSGPRIRARLAGVSALCPPEEWLLPAEQTDDQRKMASMQRDLEEAKNAKTQLGLRIDGVHEGIIMLPRLRLAPLRDDQIRVLINKVLCDHPAANLTAIPSSSAGALAFFASFARQTYLTEDEVKNYDHDYESFVGKVHSYFETLHERVDRRSRLCRIYTEIENIGSISARDLVFTASIEGDDFEIGSTEEEGEEFVGGVALPQPPEVPRSGVGRSWDMASLSNFRTPPNRDPTRFYWLDRPRVGEPLAALSCADFRPERIAGRNIWIYSLEEHPAPARLTVQVSAEHHAALVYVTEVHTTVDYPEWRDEMVLHLLPECVADAIRQMPD